MPPAVCAELGRLQAALKQQPSRVSWVKEENFHLTLRFLGNIDEAQASTIRDSLREACATTPPVHALIQGVGAFPRVARPEVLWVGAEEQRGNLALLQLHAQEAARAAGLEPETKRFHAHVTLGRLRDHRVAPELTALLEEHKDFAAGEVSVESVTLYESRLSPKGSVYTPIEVFPLQV